MGRGNVRDKILDAVNKVVAANGLGGTTLEAVAREAGVSKGGLLYYFGNKKDLLLGMLDRYETNFYERRDELLAALPDAPHRLLKASMTLMLRDMESSRAGIPNFATVLDDDNLCERVAVFKRRLFKDMTRDMANPAKAAMAMYIMDGLWMERRFRQGTIPKASRAAVVKELLDSLDAAD